MTSGSDDHDPPAGSSPPRAPRPSYDDEVTSVGQPVPPRPRTDDEVTSVGQPVPPRPRTDDEVTAVGLPVPPRPRTDDEVTAVGPRPSTRPEAPARPSTPPPRPSGPPPHPSTPPPRLPATIARPSAPPPSRDDEVTNVTAERPQALVESAPERENGAHEPPEGDLDLDAVTVVPTGEEMGEMMRAPAPPPGVTGPSVTSVRPERVDTAGGTTVSVFGAGFTPGCRVLLDGEELVSELVDAFCVRFVSPPRAPGEAEVVVESAGGTLSRSTAHVSFVEGPRIDRVEPVEGPIEGGVRVELHGRGLPAHATLSLFGVHAPALEVVSDTLARFTLPAQGDAPREGELVITGPDGLAGRSEGLFRYRRLVPRIESVEPATAWVNGGKVIAVRGADFHVRIAASVGGRPAEVRRHDAGWIDVVVPPAEAPGAVELVLEDPLGGRVTAPFTYEAVPAPPKLIDVLPASGTTLGGATIRLVGDNFGEHVRVRIAELTCVRRVVSAKLIDVDLPARNLPGKVAIELDDGAVTIRTEEAFEYVSPLAPQIASLEPRSGPTSGGTRVILEGEHFPANASVRFGTEMAKTVAVKSGARIEVVTPPLRAGGMVDVIVSAPEVGQGVAKAAFKYEVAAPPTITSVAPTKGTVDGGTELGIEGKNFGEGCVVLVGGKPAKTRRISGSLLEAHTPPGDDGQLVDVAVKNADGQQAIQKRAFQYDARYRS